MLQKHKQKIFPLQDNLLHKERNGGSLKWNSLMSIMQETFQEHCFPLRQMQYLI